MATDRDALIAAVLAAPADAAPRLILADLLEETGVLTSDEAGLLRHGLGHWRIDNSWWRWSKSDHRLLWAFPEQTFPASRFEGREANFAYNPLHQAVALVVGPVPADAPCRCFRCKDRINLTWINLRIYDAAGRSAAGWVCVDCLGHGAVWA